jgi:hypothetical protein
MALKDITIASCICWNYWFAIKDVEAVSNMVCPVLMVRISTSTVFTIPVAKISSYTFGNEKPIIVVYVRKVNIHRISLSSLAWLDGMKSWVSSVFWFARRLLGLALLL